MRQVDFNRATTETEIKGQFCLDGNGQANIKIPCGFFTHMLEQLVFHAGFDITLEATADTHVDYHHLVEDVGLCLGTALRELVSDKRGLTRYGDITLPMDDALVLIALDLSGRPYLNYAVQLKSERVGDFETELVPEFLRALVNTAGVTLHVKLLSGENSHHILEAIFKGLGRALRQALSLRSTRDIPSTKGTL